MKSVKKPYVINIQRYSIHDGDGIRTTVFFKGCALKCLWCHNPESQKFTPELVVDYEKCTDCGSCVSFCPTGAISIENGKMNTNLSVCTAEGECAMVCPNNLREVCGRQYDLSELMRVLDKDALFYEESGGGVTLSGGEVMLQDMDYVEELCRRIKSRGYHLCVDTCGHAPQEGYGRLLPYVDLFLFDLKLMDTLKHEEFTGAGNSRILSNLKFLSQAGAGINIRIPVIGGVNSDDGSIGEMVSFLRGENIRVEKVNILPYHNTGSAKYPKIQRRYEAGFCEVPSEGRMEEIKQIFIKNGFTKIKIGG